MKMVSYAKFKNKCLDLTVTISMAFANLFVGVGIDSSYLDK